MPTLRSRIILLTSAALLLVSGEGYRGNRALAVAPCDQTPDPCFTNVSDILQGRRRLLPVDDLVVTSTTGGGVINYLLETADSQISGQSTHPIHIVLDKSATAVGRMFNLPRDVIATMAAGFVAQGTNSSFTIQDLAGNVEMSFADPLSQQPTPNGMIMADFTGDGFDDIALLSSQATDGPPSTGGLLRFITANNRENIADGVVFSDGVGPFEINFAEPIAITAGDFNGDDKQEVAIAQPFPKGGAQYIIQIYQPLLTQDGKISSLRQAVQAVIDSPGIVNLQLVAGDFDGAIDPTTSLPRDELVAVIQNTSNNLVLQSFRVFTQSTDPLTFFVGLTSTFVSPDTLSLDGGGFPFFATSGRLDWFSTAEQVIATYQATDQFGNWSPVTIFTLDSQLNITQAASTSRNSKFGDSTGLAVGNFDEGLGSDSPPNLEIARLVPDSRDCWCSVEILKVDPTQNFALSVASETQINIDFDDFGWVPTSLLAGDTQGRSLRLGPPNKVTITQHNQPEVILGAPPMHVDWITPAGATTPVEFNVSAEPGDFFSQYQTQETQQNQSSRKSTTSFSYATKESTEQELKFGVPDVASVSVKLTAAAQQTHDSVVSKTHNTYQNQTFDISVKTGFDDYLWYTEKSFNLYLYPVIGQCIKCADAAACAEAADSCPAGTRPLIIQFSGPDHVTQFNHNGATIEWYQPVHEVGNVFSYPWNETQLENLFPPDQQPDQLAQSGVFFTDSSRTTQQVTWAEGSSEEQTSGSTKTFSFDTSVSTSYNVTAAGDLFEVGGSGTDTFSFNLSKSFSTLNTSVESIGESTGVGITTPGTFQDPNLYQYPWQPFIFGQLNPPATIQEITPTDENNMPVQVPTTGIVRVAFTADPTTNAGPWWHLAYTQPDVALNHPSRWTLKTTDTPLNANQCLQNPTNDEVDCLIFNPANTTQLPFSEFHWMKGFFITPAEANGEGPQVTLATAGDQLLLQARVYNYSLADMPEGSVVRVQFYGQESDQHGDFIGSSFFIGEANLAPLPGFNSTRTGGEQPNWTLASTTFDTTAYGDKYLIFWVVVWMENGGSLVAEVPGHGLTAIPGANLASIVDVPIEPYSNNVGYYNQPLYIQPQASTQAAVMRAATAEEELIIETVQVSPTQVAPYDKVQVRATVRTGQAARDGVSVRFYDGDPEAGGSAFDIERIPHIRALGSYTEQVLFQPRTCGRHTIFVVAHPGSGAPAEGTATVEVNIDPVTGVAGLRRLVADMDLPQGIENSLDAKLRAAQQAFEKGNSTAAFNKLAAFRNEVNAQRGKKIPVETAEALLAKLDRIRDCAGV